MSLENTATVGSSGDSPQSSDDPDILKIVRKLTQDLKIAAITLSDTEARFLVGIYYLMQDHRKRSKNQLRALKKEPHITLTWFSDQFSALENEVKKALEAYSKAHKYGKWLHAQTGIGPVLAAGLLAHIDIEKAPTAGHIWSFAGLVPGVKWEKGKKRPWNAELKTLCWLIGESFVKFSGHKNCFYGHLYIERKEQEILKNKTGLFDKEAECQLNERNWKEGTDAIKWYKGRLPGLIWDEYASIEEENAAVLRIAIQEDINKYKVPEEQKDAIKKTKAKFTALIAEEKAQTMRSLLRKAGTYAGMLPPAHIYSRAKRYTVKLFLAHYQEVTYTLHYEKAPPNPYSIAILGHAHKIDPPSA